MARQNSIIQFSVSNYRSFKEPQAFSLEAAAIVSRDKRLDETNVMESTDHRLLRSAAIYGANASGKSNFTSALNFFKRLILNSSKETQAEERIPTEPFLLAESSAREPSKFEAIFLVDGRRTRYGFQVTQERVVAEWLFEVRAKKETRLFTRDANGIEVARPFAEGKGLEGKTRNNALFLSVVAQFNGKISQRLQTWARSLNVVSGLSDNGYLGFTITAFEKGERDSILRFVRGLDVGITDVTVTRRSLRESLPANIPEPLRDFLLEQKDVDLNQVFTEHSVFSEDGAIVGVATFDLERNESEGTQKLFALSGPILDTLKRGNVLVVDELDARLHPLITCSLIRLFNSPLSNPHGAQLIFTTHDTNLLNHNLMRRDQVWFAEKDRVGATKLYSLAEYRVRNDAPFEKDYIRGKYGAVPFLGSLEALMDGSGE